MSTNSPPSGLERWIVPVVIILFCVAAIGISTTFEEMPPILKRGIQPADFPQLVCALIIFCTFIMLVVDPIRVEGSFDRKSLGTLLLMGVFIGLCAIDFFLALGLFAALLTVFWGERRIGLILLVGLLVPLFVFFLFDRVFEIRFPKGLLTNLWYG